jgi:hypothetical protein
MSPSISGNQALASVGAWGGFFLSIVPASEIKAKGDMATYSVTVNPFGSFSDKVTLGVTGLPAGVAASFAVNPVAAGGSTAMTIDTKSLAVGAYDLQVVGAY